MEGFVVLTTANLTAFNGLYGHYGLLVDRKAVDAHKPCAAVVYAR